MEVSESDDLENFEICPPRPDALVHSLRAFGYSLPMAIADLIDNSLTAKASNVWIKYSWDNGSPWVSITDDGDGMTEIRLQEAMRLGSRSPLETRESDDLGRFGLGLKTASFSQCRLFTVTTKTSDGEESTRFWDLDQVEKSMKWLLGKNPETPVLRFVPDFDKLQHGTVVLWQKLDRLIDSRVPENDQANYFLEKFLDVKKYLEMVFHQFLDGKNKRLNIFVGKAKCEPWDPYLTRNKFTTELSSEKYEDSRISIVPYILPHISNRSEQENTEGSGIRGWNAQQGFYIYRNGRMIVSGGYLDLDLKAEDHYKLARIKVEIPNDMDREWSIDVRKALASPPDRIRGDLLRVAKAARQSASDLYRARTGRPRERRAVHQDDMVWLKKEIRNKIVYRINPENQVLKKILEEKDLDNGWIRKLFHVIESTVPHRLIIMDAAENEDCHVGLPENADPPSTALLELCAEMYLEKISEGRAPSEAAQIVCNIEPFNSHPFYLAYLERFEEENRNGS